MSVGGVNVKETKRIRKHQKRKAAERESFRVRTEKMTNVADNIANDMIVDDDSDEDGDNPSDISFTSPPSPKNPRRHR